MQKLNLPEYHFNIKQIDGKYCIFDQWRKKFCALTPEEWVRQNLVSYLVKEKEIPGALISTEAEITVNGLRRRFDALVFDKKLTPLILIECKAPSVKLTQKVFDQIFAYNTKVSAPYLLVSNGLQHFFLKRNNDGNFIFSQTIEKYKQLLPTIY